MDPKIAKKTQNTLGKVISKPPLTDKLLGKPPFRFLHDVTTSVIKTTGFMNGLFTDSELNSENVKEKETKVAFLQKAIDMVSLVTGKSLAVRPQKIVAGHEPEKTNEFLQVLAEAIKMKVNNDEYVKKLLKGKGGGGGAETKDKEKDKEKESRSRSADKRKKESEEKKDKGRDDKEKSRDREKSRDKEKEKSRDEGKDREKSRDRDKDRSRDRDKDREHRRKKRDEPGKENESPAGDKMVNGEEHNKETHTRLQRPTSAKGSRRRREGRRAADSEEEDEEFVQKQEPAVGEADLPPQVANARRIARPSSARPAPPRPKQDGVESEPAMRLGSGHPTNVIVDNGQQSDEDDENFLVEESAPPPPEPEQTVLSKQEGEDDAEHGALVKKMLETKKEFEEGSQPQQSGPPKKTEIERPAMSDAARRKQREIVQKEINKLRNSIQSLTRSANPLGKIMDYVQEDLDSMQKELEKWKSENKEHSLALKRERGITDRSVEPLKAQLSELDQAIKDQLDLIAATKSNIIRNDQKIDKMLKSIAKS
ncbi:TRAF3-interacting protein 1-like isoform X1 [Haliotis cracherodii]|uniref:TRAF3-interacting protein 1-like isoform X1 n=1 Tax=Haliotis cracherodii TaxID=6455 RepID=UPI0039EA4A9B